jgi:lysyl-tRNA synthetase class 2
MTDMGWQSAADRAALLERALMLKNIRAFFDAKDVIEVETPLLSHHCATDPHLESLSSRFRDQDFYLNTSPEYAMKRLLAQWQQPIYQICKAFRDDELGQYHNPEFSMLEWYRPGFDMFALMDELSELVSVVISAVRDDVNPGGVVPHVMAAMETEPQRFTYQQAFEKFTGINPHTASSADCLQLAKEKNIEIPQGLTSADKRDEWLDWLLTQTVLPAFDKTGFIYLYDYPASQCSLAKVIKNEHPWPVAKRFELYFGETELANGFHELSDADEQMQRFQQENAVRRQQAKPVVPIDKHLIGALRSGLPDCSGVALGLDRLLMVKLGCKSIHQVLTFTMDNA